MSDPFVHLHVASGYSLQYGASHPQTLVERAAEHYSARNAAFAEHSRAAGLPCRPGDGLSVWLPLPAPARAVTEQLMRRGWLARPGDEFLLADDATTRHLRLTVHELNDEDARRLATDIAAAVDTVLRAT